MNDVAWHVRIVWSWPGIRRLLPHDALWKVLPEAFPDAEQLKNYIDVENGTSYP